MALTTYHFDEFPLNVTGINVYAYAGVTRGALVASNQTAGPDGSFQLTLPTGQYRAHYASPSGSNTWSAPGEPIGATPTTSADLIFDGIINASYTVLERTILATVRAMQVNVMDPAYGAKGDNSTDDYAAISAAIAACPAGGVVLFPPGQYVVTNTLSIPSNITLRGTWAARWPQYGGIPVYIKPKFGSFLGASLFSAVESDGWRIENMTLQSGRATGPAGADVHGLDVQGSAKAVRLQNVMINNFAGFGLHTDTTASGFPGGWEVSNLNIMNCSRGGWRSDNTGAQSFAFGDSVIAHSECGANGDTGWYWAGLAATDFVGLRSTFNTNGYGFAVVGACSNVGFTECQTDRSVKDGFYLNATEALSANAPAPHVIVLNGCHASRDGKNDGTQGGYAGIRIVGTSQAVPAIPVSISACQTHVSKDDQGTGQLSPDYGIYADNASRVLVNGSILNATVAPVFDNNNALTGGGGNQYNTINYSTGAITRDLDPVAAGAPLDNPAPANPSATDFGYKAWAYDPVLASNNTQPSAGVLHLVRVNVRKPATVTKVAMGITSITSMALTTGQCFIAVFDSTGAQVAVTADISAGISVGEIAFTLSSSFAAIAGRFYWVALLLNGTVMPNMSRGQGLIGGLSSGQTGASAKRFGTSGSALTAMPASFTPSGMANDATGSYWAALV